MSLAPPAAARNAVESTATLDEMSQARETPEWQAAMRLIGYGYGENLLTVGAATLEARGNRIEYRRAGPPITE
jgi:hypothetical protein